MADIQVSDKQFIDFKYNFHIYFGFLKKYKSLCVLLVFLVFFLTSLDLAFNYVLKLIVDSATDFASKKISAEDFYRLLLVIFGALLAIPLTRTTVRWLYMSSINSLESRLIADIKRNFFNHLLSLSHGFHSSHKTGSLISRLVRGSNSVETMTDVLIFQYVPIFFRLSMMSTSIFYFTRSVGISVLVTVAVYLTYSIYMTQNQQRANALFNNMSDIEKANISDVFTNIESIKYFAKERHVQNRFFDISDKTRQLQLGFWNHFRPLEAGQIFIMGMGTFSLVYISIQGLRTNILSIGTFVFLVTTYYSLLDPLANFVMGIRNMYRAIADFEDLFQYGKIGNEIKDKPDAKDIRVTEGVIEFKNVGFTYRKKPILSNLSVKVPAHHRVAFVGPSGAGKTTLIRLLYRLYDVESGVITVDGADISHVTQTSLRDSFSMVPQECILFDDTIYNNIAFSNSQAQRGEVFHAIQLAQLEKFIMELPDKENTIVGERGVKLSGGEKQRVSIARAILADKKILILDEATSSLDSETEHEIQKGLGDLMKGRTCILIAHRLSTIMSADIIVVLDKGGVAQMGSHQELIGKPGLYQKLWNLQKGGYIN